MAIPIFLALAAQADGCLAIPADRILVRDITEAVPALRPLPGDLVLGYAPAPGVRRSLLGATLERFAKNHGVDAKGLPDVCVEHPMIAPSDARVVEAMQEAWNEADEKVRFELIEWGPREVPPGKLIFPRAGIQPPVGIDPKPQVLWRGYVLYGGGKRFSVSATVRITISSTRVVALADIAAGRLVRPDQVRLESCEVYALDHRTARNLDEVVGFSARSLIRAGSPVMKSQLNRPPDVAKGDLVRVEVALEGAQLVLEGRAQTAGITGSTILVRNPTSGKDFRAQVAGKGKVTVDGPVNMSGSIQ